MTGRRLVFHGSVLLTLALAGVFAGMVALMSAMPGFMGMAHFTEEHHRIHDVTFALLNGMTVAGMVAQLRAPARHAAAQVMALIPFASLILVTALTNGWVLSPPWLLVGASAVVATMFHPIGDPLRAFRGARPAGSLVAMLGVAVLPLLGSAWTSIGLQRAGPSEHAVMGHYGYQAAFAFAVIAAAGLAAVRPDGGRLVGWVAGALPLSLGVASLVYPSSDSSLPAAWALAAIAWGAGFVGVAEARRRHEPRR